MSGPLPPQMIDAAALADGQYVLDVASGAVVGLVAETGGGITVQDENGNVGTGVTQIDFQGAGVSAAAGTGEVVVTIAGGGGSGGGGILDGGDPTSSNNTIDGGAP